MSKSMNVLQRANLTATFFVFTLIIGGLVIPATRGTSLHEYMHRHPRVIALAVYMILFRLKMFFDDHKHFGEPDQGTKNERFYGFILAVFSWLLWGLAGAAISDIIAASEILASALGISTAWIFVHLYEMRKDKTNQMMSIIRRNYWVGFNFAYIGFLMVIAFSARMHGVIDLHSIQNISFVFLFLILLVDYKLSDPYKDFWEF